MINNKSYRLVSIDGVDLVITLVDEGVGHGGSIQVGLPDDPEPCIDFFVIEEQFRKIKTLFFSENAFLWMEEVRKYQNQKIIENINELADVARPYCEELRKEAEEFQKAARKESAVKEWQESNYSWWGVRAWGVNPYQE